MLPESELGTESEIDDDAQKVKQWVQNVFKIQFNFIIMNSQVCSDLELWSQSAIELSDIESGLSSEESDISSLPEIEGSRNNRLSDDWVRYESVTAGW